jgi:hypothetical protein
LGAYNCWGLPSPFFFIEKSNTLGEKNMTVNMDAAICFKLESALKDFLEEMATSKDMSLSAYCRYVIDIGLDEIYERNLNVRELEI